MAHTPLLQSLQRLAQHYFAQQGTLKPLSRRGFLLGSVAGGLALTLPAQAATARVAIVGGGIAGLTTALILAEAGVKATVYEAAARAGGRMFSHTAGYWDERQVSEWCGEFIDSGHQTVRALAKRFNLPLTDLNTFLPEAEEVYYFRGQYYPKQAANRDFAPVFLRLQQDVRGAGYPTTYNRNTAAGRALDRLSVYDWIESRVPGGHSSPLGMLLDVAYVIEYGAATTDQSALNLVYLLGFQPQPKNFSLFGESDERFYIAGGNEQLPQAMARTLGEQVQLGMRLLKLARHRGDYVLTFQNGQTVTADFVVLTLPFAVLRTLDYQDAGFDRRKNLAIQQLGRGLNGKLHLQFTSRPWAGTGVSDGSSYSDTGYQNTWDASLGQAGASGLLVDYTGGPVSAALATPTPYATLPNPFLREDVQQFFTQIDPVYSGLASVWNGKATSSRPFLDPNFKLAYSYFRVGQYQTFGGYERVPQGGVYFAGEHTSTSYQGYMEGGASEGLRTGLAVLKRLGVTVPASTLGRYALKTS